jgi:hypothetical protein
MRKKKGLSQPQISFDSVELTTDELFAYAVYTSTANFSLFNTPEWNAFFKKLHYKPPTRQRLAGDLL